MGCQPRPPQLERAACRVADSTAIVHPGAGDWPAFVLEDSALLRTQRQLDGSWLNASGSANATIEELVPGGIDVTPLPGRYLTAPTNTSVASVRLAGTTTALCAAPDWDQLHVGCYAAALFGVPGHDVFSTPSHSSARMSLETCALACSGFEAIAVVIETCFCLPRLPTAPAVAASACNSQCPADAAQLCGGGQALYLLPTTYYLLLTTATLLTTDFLRGPLFLLLTTDYLPLTTARPSPAPHAPPGARSHGQSPPLGSAPAWPLRLLRARLAARGSSALPARTPSTGRQATASRAQASCLQSRRFHCV